MKNKTLVITATIALVAVAIIGTVAAAVQLPKERKVALSGSTLTAGAKSAAEAGAAEADADKASKTVDGMYLMSDLDLMSYLKEIATPEQLEQLEHPETWGIDDVYSAYDANAQKRKMLQIVEILPEGQPRLTIELARSICRQAIEEVRLDEAVDADDFFWRQAMGYGIVCNAFNHIAGAPDYTGGSGIMRSIYNLDNEEGAVAVFPESYIVSYYDHNCGGEKLFPPEEYDARISDPGFFDERQLSRPWDECVIKDENSNQDIPQCSIAYYTALTDKLYSELSDEKMAKMEAQGIYKTDIKQFLKCLGIMPEEVPSLTLEDARLICLGLKGKETLPLQDAKLWRTEDKCFDGTIADKFNKIAGSPDVLMSDQTDCMAYYVDGDPQKMISIFWDNGEVGRVEYIDLVTGTRETLFE